VDAYPIQTRRWTRAEYERLVDGGIFRPDEGVELLGGALVVREPQSSRHAVAIELALRALLRAFGPGWRVRVQLPIAPDDESEPEPDLSVVAGDPRDNMGTHPVGAALVVEVAETSLDFDRLHKGSLYARAQIPEYWIVNLVRHHLEVRLEPAPDPSALFGWRYRSMQVIGADGSVTPLAAPAAGIAVSELLP
jgi:Uma2 family endonuclease